MKVRYWRETTETEFYELWPETDRNKMEMVLLPRLAEATLRVITDEEMEDYLYDDEDGEDGEET